MPKLSISALISAGIHYYLPAKPVHPSLDEKGAQDFLPGNMSAAMGGSAGLGKQTEIVLLQNN